MIMAIRKRLKKMGVNKSRGRIPKGSTKVHYCEVDLSKECVLFLDQLNPITEHPQGEADWSSILQTHPNLRFSTLNLPLTMELLTLFTVHLQFNSILTFFPIQIKIVNFYIIWLTLLQYFIYTINFDCLHN